MLLPAIRTSVLLILFAIAVNLALLLPLTVVVHLRAPRLRPVLAAATLLPWLVPPAALAVGVAVTYPSPASWPMTGAVGMFYALWALPFTYRTLDAGLQAGAVRAQFELARSIAAPLPAIAREVLLPAVRPAVGAACALTAALVLAEYAFSALLVVPTLPAIVPTAGSAAHLIAPILVLIVAVLSATALALTTRALRQHAHRDDPMRLTGHSR